MRGEGLKTGKLDGAGGKEGKDKGKGG